VLGSRDLEKQEAEQKSKKQKSVKRKKRLKRLESRIDQKKEATQTKASG